VEKHENGLTRPRSSILIWMPLVEIFIGVIRSCWGPKPKATDDN
jgi:hypothetical protein